MRGRGASESRMASLSPYTQHANESHCGHGVGGAAGAGLWQLPERVPEPVARGRERREAALALPELRADAGVVGECAAGELDRAEGAVQDLQGGD